VCRGDGGTTALASRGLAFYIGRERILWKRSDLSAVSSPWQRWPSLRSAAALTAMPKFDYAKTQRRGGKSEPGDESESSDVTPLRLFAALTLGQAYRTEAR
jgi:hypothetical protein